MRDRSDAEDAALMVAPMMLAIADGDAVATRALRSGVVCARTIVLSFPPTNASTGLSYSISTCSTWNCAEAYSENMATIVLSTVCALDRSVAVHSMKTSRVASEIFDASPLMRGGSESTVPAASRISGSAGAPLTMSTYGLMCFTDGSVR